MIVVEHNLEVIAAADWVIDMGPEAGDGGGKIVVEGPPEDIVIHARMWQQEQQKKNKNALSHQPPAVQKETGSSVELLQSHTGEALDAFGGLGACGLLAPQPLGTAERPVPPSTTAPQAPSSRRAAARSRAC